MKHLLYFLTFLIVPVFVSSQTKDEPLENEMINIPLDYNGSEGVFFCGYSSNAYEVTLTYDFDVSKYQITNYMYCQMLNNQLQDEKITVTWDDENETWIVINVEGEPYQLIDAQAFYYPAYKISFDTDQFVVEEGFENHPIFFVTWAGAAFYCNYLSEQNSLEKLYDLSTNPWTRTFYETTGFRLPTTQEWEYVASYNDQREFAWGNEMPTTEHANYEQSGIGGTSPVNQYPLGVTKLGLYDFCGNLRDMTNNYNTSYDEPVTNPTGPEIPPSLTFPAVDTKGGDYSATANGMKIFWNGLFAMYNETGGVYSAHGTNGIGFRVLKTYEESSSNISEKFEKKINIYPNPSSGTFSIETDFEKNSNFVEVEITDITGKRVLNSQFSTCNSQFTIHKSGIYFIKIISENRIFIEKIIVR